MWDDRRYYAPVPQTSPVESYEPSVMPQTNTDVKNLRQTVCSGVFRDGGELADPAIICSEGEVPNLIQFFFFF